MKQLLSEVHYRLAGGAAGVKLEEIGKTRISKRCAVRPSGTTATLHVPGAIASLGTTGAFGHLASGPCLFEAEQAVRWWRLGILETCRGDKRHAGIARGLE